MDRKLRTWPSRMLARPWLAAFVPINAATSGFGVALPLLILVTLGGGWTQVAVAASLYNLAVIGASVVWGYVADHYPSRRNLLVLNFGGFAILYAILAEVHTLPLVYPLYVLVGLLAPAGASASSLLILEQFSEQERAEAYASLQEMSMIGAMAGLLVGYFWLLDHQPLPPLFLALGALAAVSAVAVRLAVKESPKALKVAQVARHGDSLAYRIVHGPGLRTSIPFFPKRPSIDGRSLARFRRWFREEVHHELPLIFAATFLFNLSSNLFNISYVPYLYALGIGSASIFLVNFANNLAQGFAFPASGNVSGRIGPDRLVQRSTYIRSLGYLAVAGFTFVPLAASDGLTLNLIAFALLGGAIAFYSTASSMILFRAVEHRDAGSILGLNSALGGLAAVAGAALAGVLATTGSYRLTFLVAGGGLLISLPLWTAVHLASVRQHVAPTAGPPAAPAPSAP